MWASLQMSPRSVNLGHWQTQRKWMRVGEKLHYWTQKAFPMVGGEGRGGDGENEPDDDSLRKIKTNKHQQLSNKLDYRHIKSAETTGDVSQLFCVSTWRSQKWEWISTLVKAADKNIRIKLCFILLLKIWIHSPYVSLRLTGISGCHRGHYSELLYVTIE